MAYKSFRFDVSSPLIFTPKELLVISRLSIVKLDAPSARHQGILWSDSPGLEKAMAAHSNTLAWKIPRTEERGRLQSIGSQRVGYDYELFNMLFDSVC